MTEHSDNFSSPDSFNNLLPRSIFSEVDPERLDKQGATFTGYTGVGNALNQISATGAVNNIMRNPSRRFYDPEITTTAIYLPRTVKQKNRWCRWFYDHDELIGAVFDLHAELPYSRAELALKDPYIKRKIEECFDRLQFFSMLPFIDLEFMKIGEVFIHTPWDNTEGMWSHIIIHNPDFAEVRFSPFADQECSIELIPSDELKSIVNSTKPEEQQLKRRIPKDVFRRVLTGKNIVLDPEEVTHIARRSNPYDVRGTSIINRLFRCFVPNTLVRMSDGTCKEIQYVNVNEEVLSKNGERRKVIDKVEYDVDTNLIEIVPEKSYTTLKSTEGHKYLIRRKYCSCGCGEKLSYEQLTKGVRYLKNHCLHDLNKPDVDKSNCCVEDTYIIEKIEAQDIHIGDQLLIPINNTVINTELNENTARLIGYYLAEGCYVGKITQKYPSIIFSLSVNELDSLAADICSILKQEFQIIARIHTDKTNGIKVVVSKKDDYKKLSLFIDTYVQGDRAWNKELKSDVLLFPKNVQLQILIGEFRGDGWRDIKYSNEVRCCTVSKNLAEQLQWMLFRNKIYSYIKTNVAKKVKILGKDSIAKESYHIRITGKFARTFIEMCWNEKRLISSDDSIIADLVQDLKNSGSSLNYIARELNAKGYIGCKGGKFYASTILLILKNNGYNLDSYNFSIDSIDVDDEYFYVPIKKINKIPYQGKVYDITVDTNHWWLGNGAFVTSNTLMYEDKLRESQITIADNFIYPLKIFKLGDPQKGWIPNESHQRALAQMLQQATFDPNFSLIYHYGLNVEYVTVADKVMRLDKEYTQIDERKMIALGVGKQFLSGETSYSSANVGLQTQLARYKAKRDLIEVRWIQKMLRIMAERNEWYSRDKKELVGQYRVKRTGRELSERLIVPKLIWHKKLMMRDDQSFLTFMNNVYAQGKGPISAITMLQYMGLSLEDELDNKVKQTELEEKIGAMIHPQVGAAGAMPSPLGLTAKIKNKLKFGSDKEEQVLESVETPNPLSHTSVEAKEFVGFQKDTDEKVIEPDEIAKREASWYEETTKHLHPVNDREWLDNLESPSVPAEVKVVLLNLYNKLSAINKKYNGNFKEGVFEEKQLLKKMLIDLYKQGKLHSYGITGYYPIFKQYYASDKELTDYSDLLLANEFEDWIVKIAVIKDLEKDSIIRSLRNLGNTCFVFGQIKGYQEQGIYTVKVANVLVNEGLRYATKDLLDKNWNLSSLISPRDEIVMLYPCIEGYDSDIFENKLDSHIQRHKNFSVNNIVIKNCPIEYTPMVHRFLHKVGHLLEKKFNTIEFVKDIIDLPEWETQQRQVLEQEYATIDEQFKPTMIVNSLNYERMKKVGTIPSLESGQTLYISNWIGMEEIPLTEQLIKNIDLINPHSEKLIKKFFKQDNLDLTNDDIQTYKIFGYITTLSEDQNDPRGYKISEKYLTNPDLDYKLKYGKAWNLTGKCLHAETIDEIQIFRDNLRLWIDFPHFLNDTIKTAFENLV